MRTRLVSMRESGIPAELLKILPVLSTTICQSAMAGTLIGMGYHPAHAYQISEQVRAMGAIPCLAPSPELLMAQPGFSPDSVQPRSAPSEEMVEVLPTEDLMREHGVLNRLLLVYEEGIRRIRCGEEVDPGTFQRAAQIIREFIEDYHEHLEERWIFPRFESAGKFVELVQVLKTQHDRGRHLTDAIRHLSTGHQITEAQDRPKLVRACELFIRMYRPHESREDTVLFPRLRQLVSPNEFAALGEQFEREEHRRFGEDGFNRIVEKVAQIEKELGIYDLAQFTP